MIKNIIMGLFSALAIYLTWYTFQNGMKLNRLGDIDVDVMSYEGIMSKSDELNAKLNELDDLNHNQIVSARSNVKSKQDTFNKKKTDYEKLEASASEAEIAEANKKQEYLLDYLWIVIGNYANDNNVRFKMDVDNEKLQLRFNITGSYVSIINFIYDLQNDKNLKFNLDGISMATSSSTDTTRANFTVSGITVKTSNTAIN